MSDVLEPALAPIRAALRRLATRLDAKPTLRQGTVTSVGPVRVQLDGDTAPTPLTPRLLAPVAPGDRVTVAHTARDLTILGVIGGPDLTGKPWRTAAGIAEVPASSEPALSVRVDFPQDWFTQAPIVVATPGNGAYAGFAHLVTSSGANVGSRRITAGTVGAHTIYWTATQMTPTSAGV